MIKNNEQLSDKILEDAGYWLAREESGDMLKSETAEFELWIDADTRHQDAYIEAHKMLLLLDAHACTKGQEELVKITPELESLIEECHDIGRSAKQNPHSLRPYGWMATIAASIAVLILSSVLFLQTGPTAVTYATLKGEMKTVMLKDGSLITLNTDTRLSASYSDGERRILLEKGEAYFEVAKDKTRPFNVIMGENIVRAVGTAFNIKRRKEFTQVTVTEGIVEVKIKTPSTSPILKTLKIGADLKITPTESKTTLLSKAQMQKTASWRSGIIFFEEEPLSFIVQELQYYSRKEIILADKKVGKLIAGGSFNTQNVKAFLKALELTLPIKIIEREKVIILTYENDNMIST